MTEKDTYNAREIATALGVSMDTVYRLLKENKIKHVHLRSRTHHGVRVTKREYLRLINENILQDLP